MWIELENFKIKTLIGVHDHERKAPQELLLNLKIEVDASLAVKSDSVSHALDYEKLHAKILELCQSSSFFLLETFVDAIEKMITREFKVLQALVAIEKPHILKDCEKVIVRNA